MLKKIGLFSFANTIPNIALEKIASYYTTKGATVFLNNYELLKEYDKIFVSVIFDWDFPKLKRFEKYIDKVEVGGSAYRLNKDLPDEIEKQKPKINIGYTSRGCIRSCLWCIIPTKEGHFHTTGDLYDFWDRKTKDVIVLDNNILADPKHFQKICAQALKHKIRLNFYQGLDHRLLTDDICKTLRKVSHRRYRFSFDQSKDLPTIKRAIKMLKAHGLPINVFFVLVGFNESFDKDLFRVNFLKAQGQDVYIARYNFTREKKYIPFCKWVNNRKFFNTMTYDEYLKINTKHKIN